MYTNLLAEIADWLVVFIENDTDFVHQSNLLSIVAIELSGAGVDVRKKSQDTLSSDGFSLRDSKGGGRHCKRREDNVEAEMPQTVHSGGTLLDMAKPNSCTATTKRRDAANMPQPPQALARIVLIATPVKKSEGNGGARLRKIYSVFLPPSSINKHSKQTLPLPHAQQHGEVKAQK